jgi:1-acyl-sn-glycerol-3-phosphate acyltransferase
MDIPVFFAAVTNKQHGFVAKKSLASLPVFGRWIEEIRSVFIERDDPRASIRAIDEGIGLLRQGFSLVIFPEGSRSGGRGMGEFKKGALRLATKPGAPIVPVTLQGSRQVFEEKGRLQKGCRVRVFIHPHIKTAGLSKQEAGAVSDAVEGLIREKLDEWRQQNG